jgi:hypothetical protein
VDSITTALFAAGIAEDAVIKQLRAVLSRKHFSGERSFPNKCLATPLPREYNGTK